MLDVNFSLIRTGEPFILKNHKMCLFLFQRSGSRFLRKSSGKGESVGVCPRFHNVLRCVFPFQPFACFSVYFGCKAGNLFGNRTSCTRDGIIIIPNANTNGVWSMKKKYQR